VPGERIVRGDGVQDVVPCPTHTRNASARSKA
jgi:hypothetical protein